MTIVRMDRHITGSRNGEPWPPAGETIDLPAREAADLIANGYAQPCEETANDEAAAEDGDTANTPEPDQDPAEDGDTANTPEPDTVKKAPAKRKAPAKKA